MTLGFQHYNPSAVGAERILAYSYYNTNGVGIAIIAQEGGADDWAAYIGADDGWSEAACIGWTCTHGAKLSREEAVRWFPHLPKEAYRA